MAHICITTSNTMVLKAEIFALQCVLRLAELWYEAVLPESVINALTTAAMKRNSSWSIPWSKV